MTQIATTPNNELSIAAITYADVERMAEAMAKSQMFGVKNKEQMLALMLISQAEGRHPAEAARDYHIIQNRPTLKADALLARFQASGGVVKWKKYDPNEVSADFSHPQSPEPLYISWSIEDAKAAGLLGKDVWKQYPRQMLKARVISEGVRAVYPAVTIGVYTPEEVRDMEPEPAVRVEADIQTTPEPVPTPWIETAEGVKYHKKFDEFKEKLGEDYGNILRSFGCEHRTDISDRDTARQVVTAMREAMNAAAPVAAE